MLFLNIVMISCGIAIDIIDKSLIIDNHFNKLLNKNGKSNIQPNPMISSKFEACIYFVVLTLSDIPIHLPF